MKNNPQKNFELASVAEEYSKYKGLRRSLVAQKMAEVEAAMLDAKAEFSTFIQSKIDRPTGPYKITVSDLARAMGTTNRKTVYDFIGNAKERAQNRFQDELLAPYRGMVFSKDPYRHPDFPYLSVAIVEDQTTGEQHEAKYRDEKWYVEYRAVTDPPQYHWDRINVPLDKNAPEWLQWLYEQESWLEMTKEEDK